MSDVYIKSDYFKEMAYLVGGEVICGKFGDKIKNFKSKCQMFI